MVVLSSLKNSSLLRRAIALRAKRINGVSWSATTQAMMREQKMRAQLIPTNFPRDVRGFFLTPDKQADSNDLLSDLKCFEKINKALQGQGKTIETPRLTVAQARNVLDSFVTKFPHYTFIKINIDSPLVTHLTWEKAISKLQCNRADILTAAEKREVNRYLVTDAVAHDDASEGNVVDDDHFDVTAILEAQEKEVAARDIRSKCHHTKNILTTSSVVECLFSRANLILYNNRSGLTPHRVEMLIICTTATKIFCARQWCTNALRNHSGVMK